MNPNDYIVDTREFKVMDFNSVPVGKTFYRRKPFPGSTDGEFIKVQTIKSADGSWVNAKPVKGLGTYVFIPYDNRVTVVI